MAAISKLLKVLEYFNTYIAGFNPVRDKDAHPLWSVLSYARRYIVMSRSTLKIDLPNVENVYIFSINFESKKTRGPNAR
jgi:hypothetical protein